MHRGEGRKPLPSTTTAGRRAERTMKINKTGTTRDKEKRMLFRDGGGGRGRMGDVWVYAAAGHAPPPQ